MEEIQSTQELTLPKDSSYNGLMLSSDDFTDIRNQANATAESLLYSLNGSKASLSRDGLMASNPWGTCHTSMKSIGIMDLEKEGAFGEDSDQELLSLLVLDSPSTKMELMNNRKDSNSTKSCSPISSNPSTQSVGGNSSPKSLDTSILALQLQEALRLAEMEISQLHSQVQSKSQHLEIAQRALMDYEEEVQLLNKQLKELTADEQDTTADCLRLERKASCDSFVKDLWRLKSGTHRIKQSLGETILWTETTSIDSPSKQEEDQQQENKILKEQQERLRVDLEDSENKARKLEEENRRLNKEKTKLKTQLIQAEEELMCVLQETPDVDEEVCTYRKRLKESQHQREVLLRDLDCTKSELLSLRSQIELKDSMELEDSPTAKVRPLQSKFTDPGVLVQTGSSEEVNNALHEKVESLQEALSLALEAKTLLEQKMEDQEENASMVPTGLKIILEDIGQLKENFQKERRMALHERTENENIILNLEQEKQELIFQMTQVTNGLNELQEETTRVQNELDMKRKTTEQYREQSERQIMRLKTENDSILRQLAQTREDLDRSLSTQRILESKLLEYSTEARMQDVDNLSFTVLLRRKVQSGNDAQVKQAALQAIEHLERLNNSSSSSSSEFARGPLETNTEEINGEGSQMVTLTSHQLRMLRKELRETSKQRDEAFVSLRNQQEEDTRRYNDIQALQNELNAALEQHEQLLPKFKDVSNSRRELELKVQSLTNELEKQREIQSEMEEAVLSLLSSCDQCLKEHGVETNVHKNANSHCLLDSILITKMDLDSLFNPKSPRPSTDRGQRNPWEGNFSKTLLEEEAGGNGSRPMVHQTQKGKSRNDWKMVVDNLRSMVDKERDLRRYFESQSVKLQKMKIENEPQSRSLEWSQGKDYPLTEFQSHEKKSLENKICAKDHEINELMSELERARSGDDDLVQVLQSLEDNPYYSSHHKRGNSKRINPSAISSSSSSNEYSEKLDRLQECAGMLEKQLLEIKAENKELKMEKQVLLKKSQSSSSSPSK